MDLLQTRQTTNRNDILENRFIGLIIQEEAAALDASQVKLMSSRGFSTDKFYNARGFQVLDGNKLQYTHPKELRFIDMKSRSTKSGEKTKKKSHAVHNKPLFSMVNKMLRRLQFEFTDKTKQMLAKEYNLDL